MQIAAFVQQNRMATTLFLNGKLFMKSVKSLKIFRLAENTFVRYLTFDLSTLKKVYYGVKFTFQIVCPHCEQAKSLTTGEPANQKGFNGVLQLTLALRGKEVPFTLLKVKQRVRIEISDRCYRIDCN